MAGSGETPTRAEGAGRRFVPAAGSRPGRLLSATGTRIRANLRDPATVLPMVLVAAFVARVAWLNLPQGGLIFDEAYYVNAARTLLGWPVAEGAHYAGSLAGLDPNTEHPPLGKLLIALSMAVFGDNGVGWRVPSVVAGMIALAATYRIVRTSGESARMGVLVVGILAFDNLTLVHGRIGTLDMLVLAPILVGSWLALRERWALAGLAIAVGILIKITAIYGVAAVLLLYLLQVGGRWWRDRRIPLPDLRGPVVFGLTFVIVGLIGLGALGARYTTFATPFDHLRRMVEYGAKLEAPVANTGFCPNADSRPWQWLFNECQIAYLRVDVTVRSGEEVVSSRPAIDFRGAVNPLLAGLIPLSALFAVWYARRTRNRLALWAIAWGAANYLPYVALAILTQRIMYIYYLLPAIPAIAVAIALLLGRAGLPRFVGWGFVVAYAVGFAAYFPFRQIP
ncbi:MAG: glycosyltransferase family 39 protein [Candidatus Limnocylindrales bacterium]